jgi:hypothetical protein
MLHLLLGDFPQGWRDYEWRTEADEFVFKKRIFEPPRWQPQDDLTGKTILLYGEQGLGDTLMILRYVPHVVGTGAKIILEVPRALISLCAEINGISQLVANGEALPAFDVQCPLMSLPYIFGTTLDTIPANVPYLAPPDDRIPDWRRRLGDADVMRVGIVWSGNPKHKNDHNRSIPLQSLCSLRSFGIELVSLQKELRPDDHSVLQAYPDIRHFGEEIRDFADTAALISLVDLVISVDTSVAHLAGAMGRPLWLLLPYSPDFRWLRDREDSPWYPTARVFRQPSIGDWDSVIERVKAEIGSNRNKHTRHLKMTTKQST